MYCGQCGSTSKGNANFCPFCGHELSRKGVTDNPEPTSEPQSNRREEEQALPLHGEGGWLRFVIFGLGIIYPVSTYTSIQGDFAEYQTQFSGLAQVDWWQAYKSWRIGIGIVASLLSIATAWQLSQSTRRHAVTLAIMALWVLLPVTTLANWSLFAAFVPNVSFEEVVSETWHIIAAAASAALIWTLYFLNSKRVSNTYVD